MSDFFFKVRNNPSFYGLKSSKRQALFWSLTEAVNECGMCQESSQFPAVWTLLPFYNKDINSTLLDKTMMPLWALISDRQILRSAELSYTCQWQCDCYHSCISQVIIIRYTRRLQTPDILVIKILPQTRELLVQCRCRNCDDCRQQIMKFLRRALPQSPLPESVYFWMSGVNTIDKPSLSHRKVIANLSNTYIIILYTCLLTTSFIFL